MVAPGLAEVEQAFDAGAALDALQRSDPAALAGHALQDERQPVRQRVETADQAPDLFGVVA
ncbi:hypothetical protein G039_0303720 [Pseudomonas aeruginosa VRFPA01]|nr:hypothetical protein G039_0303720 [Pseudomonas aeruginosa VRFPA01]